MHRTPVSAPVARVVALCSWERHFTLTVSLCTHSIIYLFCWAERGTSRIECSVGEHNCWDNLTEWVTWDGWTSHLGGGWGLQCPTYFKNRCKTVVSPVVVISKIIFWLQCSQLWPFIGQTLGWCQQDKHFPFFLLKRCKGLRIKIIFLRDCVEKSLVKAVNRYDKRKEKRKKKKIVSYFVVLSVFQDVGSIVSRCSQILSGSR